MKKAVLAAQAEHLQQIPNIGPAMAEDFHLLGIRQCTDLIGQNPYALYQRLCQLNSKRPDPCVIDTFISAVRFMEGAPALPWLAYTGERKQIGRGSVGERLGQCGYISVDAV